METLRKLSSMGRSKESQEAASTAVEKAAAASSPVRINGGGALTEGKDNESLAAPSPPRARVSDDTEDELADVKEPAPAGSYTSALKRLAASSATSAGEQSKDTNESKDSVEEEKLGKDVETETEEAKDNGDEQRESSSNGVDESSSSSNSSSSSSDEEEEEETESVSVRTMPVAKLSTENEEQEEDIEEDDEEEVDNEEEYEEANDEVLDEEEDHGPVAVGGADGGSAPRIIARESFDDGFVRDSIEDRKISSGGRRGFEQDDEEDQSDDQEAQSDVQEEEPITPKATESRELEAPSLAVGEETAVKESDVGDSFNVEKYFQAESRGREEVAVDEEQQEEKEAVPQAVETEQSQTTSSVVDVESDDIGVPEKVASEVVPLVTAELGNTLKESEAEETEHAITPATSEVDSRGASSSLLEELRKLSASRSLREQSEASSVEEANSAAMTETAVHEPSQSSAEEKESTGSYSATESKHAASNDLLAELKKLSDARLQKELSENAASVAKETSEVGGGKAEESSPSTGVPSEGSVESSLKEQGSMSTDASAPREVVVDRKVVEAGEEGKEASLDELKELTYNLHVLGRSESEASKVQSALATATDSAEQATTDSASNLTVAITGNDPEAAVEVLIMEESKVEEEADSAVAMEETSKDVVEDSKLATSPANLYTVSKAVDDDAPPVKSENGIVAETEKVQSSPRRFSAGDFRGDDGDSDADAEEEDDENDDDDDEDDEDEDETDMDTAKALAELANAVGKSGNGAEISIKPSMGAAGPSLPSLPQRPAARKSATATTALDTAARITQRPNPASSTQLTTTTDENANGETPEGNETREKLQNIRVKFLRLAHRLGQSPQNVVVAQVLYRLGLAESLRGGNAPNRTGAFSFDRANALAEEQEASNQEEELDFACTILVLGKTGVGKSATINSIFDERKTVTSAFKPSTNKVQEIVGTVHGIKVRVIDTPGLLPSAADQQHNERIMGQVKKHIKKVSPDIVLYFDRLDMQSRDSGDLPLLRTITDLFGAAVWFNAIVVLTHASSAPPDGPNGVPLSYEMFVAQRSHVVQQTIRQAAGDMRLMNPVSLVENHSACRTNRTGQRVLPNGQIWKPQLLLLCFASKILAEANSLLKLQETATPGRPFGQRSRVPPLPFLLSSLLQSRAQLKLPDEQLGESDESDDEEEEEDSDADDYDELPPFRPLSKEELEELDKEQRQDYMDELADRERLFQKKQYRDEMRRRKEMKKRAAQMSKEELAAQPGDEADDEAGKAAAVPVPMPDMALPPSFDSDNPTHRYRYLETANQWLVRPVLETHGWDHDAGYDGFNVEKMFVVKDKIPASVSGQVTKDKKEAQINFEAAASLKHGEGKVTLTGFDVQTIGKDLAYTLRAETRFNNFKRNKTTAGLTCTVLNDTVASGLKLEDRILIGKRIKMVVNGGVLTGKGDKAFGGSLEATLRGVEYPLSRTLSTLGLSVMDWHGDLAIGGNLQSQFMVGKTMMVGRANLNNRGSGQVSIRASSSEQLQMVLIGVVPILRSLINCRFGFGQPSQ